MIENLVLQHFRCFKDLNLSFSPGINLIQGCNGSGKTSILESIYLASRGRSFRTTYLSDLILRNYDASIIVLTGDQTDNNFRIGCSLKPSALKIKLNQQFINSRVDLLDYVPLQIITPVSHQLIDSGPSNRRKFIDWGLFHVEQSYRQYWSKFRRILKQRNKILRDRSSDFSAWDEQFIEYSLILSEYQSLYLSKLAPYFTQIQKNIFGFVLSDLDYYPGWSTSSGLKNVLYKNRDSDLKRGFTNSGPQKADIKLRFIDSKQNYLSRGQQKMLVFALQLSQCIHLSESKGLTPLLLIDDISSELDKNFLNQLVCLVCDLNIQAVFSVIDEKYINEKHVSNLFHVEHKQVI